MPRKFIPLYVVIALLLVLAPLLAVCGAPVAAASPPLQFAYVATDGSLHLHDAVGGDVALSAPAIYSTTLQVDEYESAYADKATFSPDGRYLAYRPSEGGTLTVVDVSKAIGSGYAAAKQFSQPNAIGQIAFSPNSRYLAFESSSSGQRNEYGYMSADTLMVVDLVTAKVVHFVKGAGHPLAWSADGKLAYSLGAKVVVGQMSAKGIFQIIANFPIPASKLRVDRIAWSPSNKTVAIVTERSDDYINDLYLASIGAKTATLIAQDANLPQWTADGKAIFYRQVNQYGVSRNNYKVFYRPLGGKPSNLGTLLDDYSSFSVAPFMYNGNYVFNNILVSPSGKVVGKLWDYYADVLGWSPNSSSKGGLAAIEVDEYAASDNLGNGDTRSLQVVAVPGGQVSSIYTSTGIVDAGPSIKLTAKWSPDGSHLAFYAMGGSDFEDMTPLTASAIGIVTGDNPATLAKFDYAMPVGWLNNSTALFQDLNVYEQSGSQAIYSFTTNGTPTKLVDGVFLAIRPAK